MIALMTNISVETNNQLKSINDLTEQEYQALSKTLAKMRAPQAETLAPHSKMLAAVRNQLQQRLSSGNNLNANEKEKLMRDIADLDHKMNASPQ